MVLDPLARGWGKGWIVPHIVNPGQSCHHFRPPCQPPPAPAGRLSVGPPQENLGQKGGQASHLSGDQQKKGALQVVQRDGHEPGGVGAAAGRPFVPAHGGPPLPCVVLPLGDETRLGEMLHQGVELVHVRSRGTETPAVVLSKR